MCNCLSSLFPLGIRIKYFLYLSIGGCICLVSTRGRVHTWTDGISSPHWDRHEASFTIIWGGFFCDFQLLLKISKPDLSGILRNRAYVVDLLFEVCVEIWCNWKYSMPLYLYFFAFFFSYHLKVCSQSICVKEWSEIFGYRIHTEK